MREKFQNLKIQSKIYKMNFTKFGKLSRTRDPRTTPSEFDRGASEILRNIRLDSLKITIDSRCYEFDVQNLFKLDFQNYKNDIASAKRMLNNRIFILTAEVFNFKDALLPI